jgi:hypothetical protein
MDVKIGVVYTAKELVVDTDQSVDDVVAAVEAAVAQKTTMLWLVDRRGRRVGVPADKLAYVEFGEDEGRKVGFGRT